MMFSMPSWGVMVALCPVLATAGQLADRLLLKSEKRRLHSSISRQLSELRRIRVRDLPASAAAAVLRGFRMIFGKPQLSLRGVLAAVATSCVLTLGAFGAGIIEGSRQFVRRYLETPSVICRVTTLWFVENAAFDFLTLLTLGFALRRIAERSSWRSLAYIVATAALAIGAGLASVSIALLISGPDFGPPEWTAFSFARCALGSAFRLTACGWDVAASGIPPWFHVMGYFGATTLLPTAVCLIVLLTLYLIKLATSVVHTVMSRFFQRMAETEPDKIEPFTVIGLAIGLLGLIAKAVWSIKRGTV
jgi:hypothetical protein